MNRTVPTGWGDIDVVGTHHISTLPRYWLSRIYVALSAGASAFTTWNEPGALTHKLIDQTGQVGWMVVAVQAALCILAIIDVIVNDLLPERFVLEGIKAKRHFVYIALAISIIAMSYVFVAADGGVYRPLVLPFWTDAAAATVIAFLDLFQRHRVKQ